jgi:hypothetical protein
MMRIPMAYICLKALHYSIGIWVVPSGFWKKTSAFANDFHAGGSINDLAGCFNHGKCKTPCPKTILSWIFHSYLSQLLSIIVLIEAMLPQSVAPFSTP